MKKILIGLLIFIILIVAVGGIFFLIDKAEYYGEGKTLFTLNENMGKGITRRIGLGYVMYTRSTGFPSHPNDNIITSWFNSIKRDEAIEKLLGDDVELVNLNDEDQEITKYYSQLIMNDLNKNANQFKLDEINTIYINLNNFVNLKTDSKLSTQVISAIQNTLIKKLDNSNINIVNKSLVEIQKDTNIYVLLLKSIKNGIYVDIVKTVNSNQVEVVIYRDTLNIKKTKYNYDLTKLTEDTDYNIFEEVR